jgi:hypothetical protein
MPFRRGLGSSRHLRGSVWSPRVLLLLICCLLVALLLLLPQLLAGAHFINSG